MNQTYLTIGEVAAILRVDPSTIYRWLWRKELRGRKFGKVWRIPVGEVTAKVEAK